MRGKLLLFLLGITLFSTTSMLAQEVIFEERFDTIEGTGGNDDGWSGNIATVNLATYLDWTLVRAFKGDGCVKLGTGSAQGILTTPELTNLNGDAVLTFRAGAWNGTNEKTNLLLEISGGGVLSESTVVLEKGSFSTYTVSISGGTSETKLVFKGEMVSNSRFFIDDVLITSAVESGAPEILTTEINGVFNSELEEIVSVTNNPSSYTYTGTLPAGIAFEEGVFSGTPTSTGTFTIQVVATNSFGSSSSTPIVITIDKAEQVVEVADNIIVMLTDGTYELPSMSNGGLVLTYTVVDTSIATVASNVLTLLTAGTAPININQSGNDNYLPLSKTVQLTVLEGGSNCGSENFDALDVGTSYTSGSFIGNNNIEWNYVASRDHNEDANESGIDGKALMLRRVADGSKVYSGTISGGIGDFSMKMYKGFTGNAMRQAELFINDVSQGVSDEFNDFDEHVFSVEGINLTGDIVIEIRNITSGQLIVDDITWTCYSDGETNITETVWDGSTWSNGTPTATIDAVIAGDFTSTVSIIAKSLVVEPGASFVLSGGDELNVGDITNEGTFSIAADAIILQDDEAVNTGQFQVEYQSQSLILGDLMTVSSPVTNQNLYEFSAENLPEQFYVFDSFATSFNNEGLNTSSLFENGKAYGIEVPNTFTEIPTEFESVFTGVLNNGVYTQTVANTGAGFNMLGNPYASMLDVNAFFEENTHLDAAAYFYVNANGLSEESGLYEGSNFAVYNQTGFISADNSDQIYQSIISSTEAFVVKSNTNAAVVFNNSMRVGSDASRVTFDSYQLDRFWLGLLNSEGNMNQMLVGYVQGATNGRDRWFDAAQLPQETFSLTSLIQDEAFSIQGKAFPFQIEDQVPLKLELQDGGVYKIELKQVQGIFESDQEVFLKDLQDNSVHNISESAYSFESEAGVFTDRFVIVFEDDNLSVKNNENAKGVVVFKKEQVLNIYSNDSLIKHIEVIDGKGGTVLSMKNMDVKMQQLDTSSYAKGLYFVKIETEGGRSYIEKVLF